ncbi:hypothetical protein VYU27_006787 [Nannochloropsis oceanica]
MSGGGPVLKPSTLRAWKVTTGVATFFTGFQLLFRTDYGEREHVFTPIQRWYTDQVDALLGVESEIARRLKTPTLSLAPSQEGEERARVASVAAAAAAAVTDPPLPPVGDGEGEAGRQEGVKGWKKFIKWW